MKIVTKQEFKESILKKDKVVTLVKDNSLFIHMDKYDITNLSLKKEKEENLTMDKIAKKIISLEPTYIYIGTGVDLPIEILNNLSMLGYKIFLEDTKR